MLNVLVPFDGSNPSVDALSFACEKFHDDDITVLYVVDTSITHQPEKYVGMKLGDIYEQRESEGESHLDDAVGLAAEHDVSVTRVLKRGEPSRVILEAVNERDIEHVVIGSHSQSIFERFFLGSVAERVVERAPASVTVIRS